MILRVLPLLSGLVLPAVLATPQPASAQSALAEPLREGDRLAYPEGSAIPRHLTPAEQRFLAGRAEPKALRQDDPPEGRLHCAAEYEPTEAILVAWEGPGSWKEVLADLGAGITTAGDAELHVMHEGTLERDSAETMLLAAGADGSRLRFFDLGTDTIWIRDYGPRYLFQDDVRVIVDHVYNRPRPTDDTLPERYGERRGHARYVLDLVHGGGNYHLTSPGSSWATELIANENPALSDMDIQGLWRDYQGLETTLLPAFPRAVDSTQHLDMWALPLADDKILVSDWPLEPGSTQDLICDEAALAFELQGLQVFRTPAFSIGGVHYTYTNAVICNDAVMVPAYTEPTVAAFNAMARDVFLAARPDLTVVPIPAQSIVTASGVVHCIVMHVPRARGGGSPTTRLQGPRGCRLVEVGQEVAIEWISDDDVGTRDVDLWLSLDGGESFDEPIALAVPDTGVHAWTVPDLPTARARVRLVVHDDDGNSAVDESEADFVIRLAGETAPPTALPLFVRKDPAAPRLELSVPETAMASAHHAYEGEIGTWYGEPRSWCRLAEGDPRVRADGSGRVRFVDEPLPGSRWFLVSTADCLSESAVRPVPMNGACGPTP